MAGMQNSSSTETRETVKAPAVAPSGFSWWWPSSSGGKAAFLVVLVLSALTGLVGGPLAVINVAFWYLVAVGIRFIFLKTTRSQS